MNPSLTNPPRIATVDLLHRSLSLLEHAFLRADRAEADPPPRLVAIEPLDDQVNLGFHDVADDPLESLQGLTAPPGWSVVGFVGPALARRADTADPTPPVPVEVVHLVARTGHTATAHRRVGEGHVTHRRGDDLGWAGLLDDHLRRTLSLPTAPAPSSTLNFWTLRWLDDLVGAALRGDLRDADWEELSARHPATRITWRAGDASSKPIARSGHDIVEAGHLLARTWTWPALRTAARAGLDVVGSTSPALAEWLDDGLFARLHLAHHPPLGELISVLEHTLRAGELAKLLDACRAWGVQV